MTALILMLGIVIAAAIFGLAFVIAAKRQAGPTRELATAVSVLEKIVAYDDAVTALSPTHRAEAVRVISNYKKELT